MRRGRQLAFVEVKAKSGSPFGDPFEMVTEEKQRRLGRAAWLAAHPQSAGLDMSFEVIAFRAGRLERLKQAF